MCVVWCVTINGVTKHSGVLWMVVRGVVRLCVGVCEHGEFFIFRTTKSRRLNFVEREKTQKNKKKRATKTKTKFFLHTDTIIILNCRPPFTARVLDAIARCVFSHFAA